MKRETINNIVEKLVVENKIENGTYIDTFNGMEVVNENINFKVTSIFATLANYANATQGLEWASYGTENKNTGSKVLIHKTQEDGFGIYQDIPASEAYASIIEGMHHIAKDYSTEQLEMVLEGIETNSDITKIFLGRVKEYATLLIKNYLTSPSKKSRSGKLIGREVADIITSDDEGNAVSFIESQSSTNEGTRNAVIELFGGDYHDSRVDWIVDNLDSIFTKNQCEYLRGTKQKEMTKQDRSKIRKNMQNRLLKALEKEFGTINHRLISIRAEIRKIESILEAKDFVKALFNNVSPERETMGKATVVDDALAEFCSPTDIKKFMEENVFTPELIKPLRVALFKKLGDLIEAEERWENYNPEPLVGTELVKVYEGDEVVAMVTAKEKEKIYQASITSSCLIYKDKKKVEEVLIKLESKKNYEKSKGLWFSDIVNQNATKTVLEFEGYHNKKNKKNKIVSKVCA